LTLNIRRMPRRIPHCRISERGVLLQTLSGSGHPSSGLRLGFCALWLWLLLAVLPLQPTHAQGLDANVPDTADTGVLAPDGDDPTPVTNASSTELRAIRQLFTRLERSVAAHDATALKFLGIINPAPQYAILNAQTRLTHVAVSPTGALVRQRYQITGAPDDHTLATTLGRGVHELWLTRLNTGEFAFTSQHWQAPADAVAAFSDAAREEWNALAKTNNAADETATQVDPNGVMLHLVAAQRGGRWLALRRSRWNGALLDRAHLLQTAATMDANAHGTPSVGEWLTRQMARFPTDRPGVVHFILQRGPRGWVGLGAVAEPNTRFVAVDESTASAWRQQIKSESYLSARAHREFAVALSKIELYAEAADEYEKAEALEPGLIGTVALRQAQAARNRDPQAQTIRQLQNEASVGLGAEHPTYVINALVRAQQSQPSVLNTLRIGLEYSKLADDKLASTCLDQAQMMIKRGALTGVNPDDAAWVNVLFEHLQDRKRLAPYKPPNVLRSALFTVRCWPNDLDALKLLAALEAAQHTVYADFGVPMGSTEVVLWRTQNEFQHYTSEFSQQATSEFVAALTLTKLIATQQGPVVLGEEINVFIDPRTDPFSTVAHEYGHVAVRHLSRGRFVPVWFNEGIASAVEGGYDGYVPRVRRAVRSNNLLSMRDMQEWDVDGERAFLAYSQANSIIDYIVSNPRWGRPAMLEILRQLGQDVAPDTAFHNVLGLSTQELWDAWAQEGIR